MIKKKEFLVALKVSIPVMMGYLVLGFAFGLLGISFGLEWYIVVLMSIFIYAGALQFLAIGFFNSKMGLFDIFISSFFVNIRQSFYGLSVLKKFKNTNLLKPYLIFGLTDETYGLLTTVKEGNELKKKYYYFYLALLNQSYWVFGTLLGIIFANLITFNSQGLEFSLTALFVVLTIEQYKQKKSFLPFLIGAFSSIFAIILVPINNMLLMSIGCSLIAIFIFKSKFKELI